MRKIEHTKFWIALFLVASIAVIGFYWYVWTYKPVEYKLPKFSIVQILLMFAITFFPSIISRLYANIKTGQVEFDSKGIIDTIRDAVHGWYSYYILAFIAFILWDYLIFGEFPQFW
jgi:hypothetical protein